MFRSLPDSPREEHEPSALLENRTTPTLPLVHFVAETPDHRIIGFLEAGLRSHADCCNTSRPVGYIEGWYVEENYRRQDVGRQLLAAAEDRAAARAVAKWPQTPISTTIFPSAPTKPLAIYPIPAPSSTESHPEVP